MSALRIIHLGNPGKGTLECGAPEKRKETPYGVEKNWSWSPGKVTCKRCLASYDKRVDGK